VSADAKAAGWTIPEEMRWQAPAAPPAPTEEQLVALEDELRELAAVGAAIGLSFGVDGEMHRRGHSTKAEREAAKEKTERLAAVEARSAEVDASLTLGGIEAAVDATLDGLTDRLSAVAARAAERGAKTLKKAQKKAAKKAAKGK
jgi:hypothetical protein